MKFTFAQVLIIIVVISHFIFNYFQYSFTELICPPMKTSMVSHNFIGSGIAFLKNSYGNLFLGQSVLLLMCCMLYL